jgi:carboxypeptidase T
MALFPMSKSPRIVVFVLLLSLAIPAIAQDPQSLEQRFIQTDAQTRESRTLATNLGMSIEFVRSDSSWGFADAKTIAKLEENGIRVIGNFDRKIGRAGHEGGERFPGEDERFHDYTELKAELFRMEKENPEVAKVHVIGSSYEGREIYALQLNTNHRARRKARSNKPGAIYLGAHHAREHLSTEIPLLFADYLLKNKRDPKISALLESRDVWIVPLVNPDGSEYDISDDRYHLWRKNRRPNDDGTFGTDLNRNYGYRWGGAGASGEPNSDIFRGPKPFSEPETQAIKKFVEDRGNAKVLLSFHTYSELILYPWGYRFESIDRKKDLEVFETMAKTMAQWNLYKPQQSSDLYITSGDTTDWAYGEHGIFAFTFELSPATIFEGGFYPGQAAIDPTFAANLKPALYLLEMADDPYRAVSQDSQNGNRAVRNRFEIHPLDF